MEGLIKEELNLNIDEEDKRSMNSDEQEYEIQKRKMVHQEYLKVVKMNSFERIELIVDDYPLLEFRKHCLRFKALINLVMIYILKLNFSNLLQNYKEQHF